MLPGLSFLLMHSRDLCLLLLVRPKMGYHPLNKTAHTDWDQMFFPLRGCHFSKLVPRGCLGA